MSVISTTPQLVNTSEDPGLEYLNQREIEVALTPTENSTKSVVYEEVTQVITNVFQVNAPSGANGQLQFNQNGQYVGDTELQYDPNTDTLTTGSIIANSITITGNASTFKLPGGNNNDVLTTDGTGNLAWANVFPSVSGNTGKFLVTNGVSIDWSSTSYNSLATTTYVTSAIADLVGTAPAMLNTLAEIANVIGQTNDPQYGIISQLANKANISNLAQVAFSGSYSDLSNKPTISTAGTTGNYSDLNGKPTIPTTIMDLGISDGAVGQVLTANGNGTYRFTTVTGGSSYNQDLNTTNNVTFSSVTSSNISSPGNVVINTQNGTFTWNFTSTGALLFPQTPYVTSGIVVNDNNQELSISTDRGSISIWPEGSKWLFGANGNLTLPNSGTINDNSGGAGTPGILINRTLHTPDDTDPQNFGEDTITILLDNSEGIQIANYLGQGIGVKVWFNLGNSYSITSCVKVANGTWTITAVGMGDRFSTFETNALIFIYTGSTPNTYTNFPQYVAAGVGATVAITKGNNTWEFGNDGNLTLPAGGDIVDSTGTSVLGGGTGNWNFRNDTIYNLSGGEINNSDTAHGATSGLILPVNGNTTVRTALYNTYGNVQIQVANLANSASTSIWNFGTDGNLTLPGEIVKLEVDDANPSGGLVVSVDAGTGTGYKSLYKFGRGGQFTSRSISLTNANGVPVGTIVGDGYGPIIGAGAGKEVWVSSDGQHLWRFTADRSFVLPAAGGNIRSEGNINIDVNLTDSTLRRWQFGEDGKLSLPDTGKIASGAGTAQLGSTRTIATDSNDGTGAGTPGVVDVAYDNTIIPTYYYPGGGAPNFTDSTITFQNGDVRTITSIIATGGYIEIAYSGATTTSSPEFPIILKTGNYVAATTAPEWTFGTDGNLTLPQGTILSETANSTTITPPNALAGQGLVVRLTGATGIISDHPGGFADGDTVTLTVTPDYNYNTVTGTVDYTFTGTGVTSQTLGRALTGTLTFTNETAKPISWTIPVASTMTTFTITLSNASGFDISTIQPLTLTKTGSSEDHHIHLIAGDPSITDIYLGDDDQYVKIEKNGGNVVIGTDTNSRQWTFDFNGTTTFPGNLVIAGNTSVFGTNRALIQPSDDLPLIALSSGANGAVSSVWVEDIGNVGTSNIAAVYANPTVGSGIVRIVVGQNGSNTGPNLWDFDATGNLTLPTGGHIIVSGGIVGSGASPAPTLSGFSSVSALEFKNGTSNVTVNANSNLWKFDSTGNLTIPGSSGGFIKTVSNASIGIAAVDNGTDNPAQLLSINAGSGAATSIVSAYATNASIQTNATGAINTWKFDNAGNLTLPANTFAINYANGIQVSLGSGSSSNISNGNSNVSIATANGNVTIASAGNTTMTITGTGANITGTLNVTGNISTSTGTFVGNGAGLTNVTVNAAGNIQGTSSNVSLVAGSYTMTFDNTGILTLPRMGGDEGGEINFGIPASNTTLTTRVAVDIYQDRFRIFDGSTKGVYIDLSQAGTGVGTLLNNRVSGLVNAGTFVTMDLIKATVTTTGNRGLSLATTTGTFSYNIGGNFGISGAGSGGQSLAGQTLTTTATTSIFGWGFTSTGDTATYVLTDTTNSRCYRITLQIGTSFNNNMISIERLI